MKNSFLVLVALWVPAACYGLATVPSTEPTEAAAILNKALKAAGGEARLSQFRAAFVKSKGTFYQDNDKATFTSDCFVEGLTKVKIIVVTDVSGVKSKEVRVLNGDKGWTKEDDSPSEEMDASTLAEEKEGAFLGRATMLAPLRNKEFKLAPAGEISVGKRPAVGITVSREGYKDVKLFFDKVDGLLLKAERPSKPGKDEDEETEEVFFSDYREVQGTRQAMKLTYKHGGKLFCEAEITELKFLEKLPVALFRKP